MDFKITEKIKSINGITFIIDVNRYKLSLFFTEHALFRIKKWELNINSVIETLLFPEEVVTGHSNRFIAHKRYNVHIIRVVYEYKENIPFVVTVYFPYSERYFKGGGIFEDKIFKRS